MDNVKLMKSSAISEIGRKGYSYLVADKARYYKRMTAEMSFKEWEGFLHLESC